MTCRILSQDGRVAIIWVELEQGCHVQNGSHSTRRLVAQVTVDLLPLSNSQVLRIPLLAEITV